MTRRYKPRQPSRDDLGHAIDALGGVIEMSYESHCLDPSMKAEFLEGAERAREAVRRVVDWLEALADDAP